MYSNIEVVQIGTGWERYVSDRPPYNMVQYMRYHYVSSSLGDYRQSHEYLIFLPSMTNGFLDQRHQVKDMVVGLCHNGETKAYPFNTMLDRAVINDVVGDDRMGTVFDADSRTALTYFSEIDHQLLSIYAVEPEGLLPVEFMDVETRSRWKILGEAVAGPLEGRKLVKHRPTRDVVRRSSYWSNTEVWAPGEGVVGEDDTPQITAVEETFDATP